MGERSFRVTHYCEHYLTTHIQPGSSARNVTAPLPSDPFFSFHIWCLFRGLAHTSCPVPSKAGVACRLVSSSSDQQTIIFETTITPSKNESLKTILIGHSATLPPTPSPLISVSPSTGGTRQPPIHLFATSLPASFSGHSTPFSINTR